MTAAENLSTWQFAAFGKHPTARDYFRVGNQTPTLDPLFHWVEQGYGVVSASGAPPEFRSWRFWSRGKSRDTLICGVVRLSSDSLGRPYPLVIAGAGRLPRWEERWDLLPFACEKSWAQMEYLAANLFDDLKKLEEEIRCIREPEDDWHAFAGRCRELNETGSTLDPFASFLDIAELRKRTAAVATQPELLISLDRGPCHDKILPLSLWHHLLKEAASEAPLSACMGGTLERAYLAVLRRPLARDDFGRLWGSQGALPWKYAVGTEHSMDISALGRDPIRPDKPAGSDVKYDAAFEELQTELEKLSTPSAAGGVNWEKVVRFSSDILSAKSKDLLVASWLCVALIHTRGLEGFGIGVKLYLDLLERFWDDMYPPKERMRGRVRSVEWWLEKAETALKGLGVQPVPARQVAVIRENVEKVDRLLAERLEDVPPLVSLLRVLDGFSVQNDAPQKPAESHREAAAEPAPAVERTAAVPPHEPPRPVILDGDPLNDGLRMLREGGYRLWEQDPSNPLAYRLNRKAAWLILMELPPATDGRTRIPAPELQVRRMIFQLRDNGDAEALLKAAEVRVSEFIFWLDLHRLVAESLSRLGGKFEKAAEEVVQATAEFVRRLPGVDDYSFADGTPFADPETREWLRAIAADNGVEAATAAHSSLPAEAVAAVAEEGRLLVRKGKLLEGVELFAGRMREAGSGRDRLAWRMALVRTLIGAKQHRQSVPYLELLLEDVQAYRLEEFEPVIALDALKLAWQGLEGSGDAESRRRSGAILSRIARLDAVEAVRLGKG